MTATNGCHQIQYAPAYLAGNTSQLSCYWLSDLEGSYYIEACGANNLEIINVPMDCNII